MIFLWISKIRLDIKSVVTLIANEILFKAGECGMVKSMLTTKLKSGSEVC